MRQFVLGLLVAVVGWWGYGKYFAGEEPGGGAGDGNVPGASRTGGLSVEQLAQAPQGRGDAESRQVHRGGEAPISAATTNGQDAGAVDASTSGVRDLDHLLEKVATQDVEAIGLGWRLVAAGRLGRDLERVVEALRPKGERFDEQLRWLGANNAFLHSSAGRDAAKTVLRTAMSLPDPAALKAGSQLVYLMTRGRIELQDHAAREAVDQAYAEHRVRVDRWLCNPTNVAGARSYTVKGGDNLDGIARHFREQGIKVEAGTIQVLNRISNPRGLRVGQQLKVPVAPVSALLEKRSFALMLFVGDELLRLYWVGHGENDHTPVTTFTVEAKQPRPQWTAPNGQVYPYGHPENILGEYFIKFAHPQYTGFGAHGTPHQDTICTQSSAGCIRMKDADIDELFRIVPRGSEVVVRATESVR